MMVRRSSHLPSGAVLEGCKACVNTPEGATAWFGPNPPQKHIIQGDQTDTLKTFLKGEPQILGVAQILIGLMKVCLFAIGLCFYSSDLSYRCYPLTMVSGYLIWGSLFVILRVGSCVYRCWEKDDVKPGRKSMRQRDIGDTDHSLPDQRQPGNEHAQCRGWGNRGNHLNSRTDCGSWTGKKVSYSCGVRRVRVPSQDAQSLGKNNDITSVDLEVLHSLEGIRDCNISPLPAGSQHHYLSFCVWVQDDLLCHTGGGYPANQ
ncbi:uncharacterized protein LOC105241294 isoform X3 [Ailuropoda melanoleuca]|uniref:uncharacterized protein LOC105241294 isoform X3 n=1 Tax=Ailuropoda melanoleuca TaxID=9646 RepID=UPI0014944B6C|nr:uncharacterized protein LOC105241294 isoform X3 [Ailuropoda melanoleuca]